MELIPRIIRPYFNITQRTMDSDSSIIEGMLTCCGTHDFEVFVAGEIRHSLFSKMFLCPENDKIVFEARCKKCGKVIQVFDSSSDGYGQCGKKLPNICVSNRPVDCIKCRSESFSVTIKYEYPDVQELQELAISDVDNAFTWIWITLECNSCGAKYKRFLDCETA